MKVNSSSHEEINLNNDNEYIGGNSSENNNDYTSKRESIVENGGKEIELNYSNKDKTRIPTDSELV